MTSDSASEDNNSVGDFSAHESDYTPSDDGSDLALSDSDSSIEDSEGEIDLDVNLAPWMRVYAPEEGEDDHHLFTQDPGPKNPPDCIFFIFSAQWNCFKSLLWKQIDIQDNILLTFQIQKPMEQSW